MGVALKLKDIQEKTHKWLNEGEPAVIKKRQNMLFLGVLGFFCIGFLVFMIAKVSFGQSHGFKEEELKRSVETAKASVDQRGVWVNRLEMQLDRMQKRYDQLESLVTTQVKQNMALNQLTQLHPGEDKNISLATPISPMDQQGKNTLSSHLSNENTLQTKDIMSGGSFIHNEHHIALGEYHKQKKIFMKVDFNLEADPFKKDRKSIDHFVPAGTFVKARLTSGVVASTGVGSASEPQPIHMEMTDYGNLPRGFKTDLKRCFLIGSAYGDLASERVFMRLETLSCVERKSAEVIELKVDGYVSGEDGANGMRGIIVDKSGPAMRNAFFGGFLSGVGGFLADKNGGTTQISPMGVTSQQALNATELLKGGAGKGVGNAMEKMADFYIKRAEQLQPVIEIEPGREIDVVFKSGFDMNQTLYRQTLKVRGELKRHAQILDEE